MSSGVKRGDVLPRSLAFIAVQFHLKTKGVARKTHNPLFIGRGGGI